MDCFLTSWVKNLEVVVTEVQDPETGQEDREVSVPGERLDVVSTEVTLNMVTEHRLSCLQKYLCCLLRQEL